MWEWQKVRCQGYSRIMARESGMIMDLLTEMKEDWKRSRWLRVDDYCSRDGGTWCFAVLFFFGMCIFEVCHTKKVKKKKNRMNERKLTDRGYI